MAIQWRESLAIGVKEIDDQHKKLFEAIDKLFIACSQGKGKEEVGNTIKFLEDYTIVHFTSEQEMHKKYNYPEREAHKKIHEKFLQSFTELKEHFEREGASVLFIQRVNRQVVDWLVHHIGNQDKAFSSYAK
jgi:hemerythrin